MTSEEKLKAIDDNAQLALEFTKEFNECIEKQVPKECAALAVLHDLADWKDQHPRKGFWDSENVCGRLHEIINSDTIGQYLIFDDENIDFDSELFFEDLRKAMKE